MSEARGPGWKRPICEPGPPWLPENSRALSLRAIQSSAFFDTVEEQDAESVAYPR